MASSEELTEYERRRIETIKRNGEMMTSFQIQSRLSELQSMKKKIKLEKKPKPETPAVSRRSLRNQGMQPHSSSCGGGHSVRMSNAHMSSHSHQSLVGKLKKIVGEQDELLNLPQRITLKDPIDVNLLRLEPGNVAQIVPKKIFVVKFFPTKDVTMVVAGDRDGNLGFWDVKAEKEDGNGGGTYNYRPHSAAITGISVQPLSLSKMYTSSDDGFLRLMDVEKEVFHSVYSTINGSALSPLSQQPSDANSIYFAEGRGYLNMFDVRVGKISGCWSLHEGRISSVDFNPENANIMATSARDGLVCLWDLRKIGLGHTKSNAWQTVNLGEAVNSAYFSPSGSCLATTSFYDKVDVLSGVNYEDRLMIDYDISKMITTPGSLRAIWGWDDTYIYIGNRKRRVCVLSNVQGKTAYALESSLISSALYLLDAHPFSVGTLAATKFGQVYVWMSSL